MSYILDALRRAEQERQRGRRPDLRAAFGSSPPASPRRLPWVLFGALVIVNLVAVGIYVANRPVAEKPVAENNVPKTSPARHTATAPPDTARTDRRIETLPDDSVRKEPAGVASGGKNRLAVNSAESHTRSVASDPPLRNTAATTATTTERGYPARRRDMPADSFSRADASQDPAGLKINFHAYSTEPADRFVIINMQRFSEGEELVSGGPVLKAITPTGVEIDFGDRDIFLPVGK